jgi:hypothetical protein
MPPKTNQTTSSKAKENKSDKNKTRSRQYKREYKYKSRVPHGPHGMKLKQVQYHQFPGPVAIYHFQVSFLSISNFKSLLKRQEHGYVNTLLSTDPLFNKPVMDGDEMPSSCLEVGYLKDVFVVGGSALGLRWGNGIVEWLCFDRDIKTSILDKIDVGTDVYLMLFEHVGDTLRPEVGPSRKVRFTEHRDWFECLKGAGRKPVRLGLTWKKYGTELQTEHLRLRRKREREEMGLDEEEEEENVEKQEDEEEEDREQEDAEEEYGEARGNHWPPEMHDPGHLESPYALARERPDSQTVPNLTPNFHFHHPNIAPTIEKHTPFIYRDHVHRHTFSTSQVQATPCSARAAVICRARSMRYQLLSRS